MEYPREESEQPSGEEMEKRSKYLMILVAAIVLIAVVLLFRDLIFKPTLPVIPTSTPFVSPTAMPSAFQPVSFEFEPREYEMNGSRIVFEHALSIVENGRNELLTFTNYGNQSVKFSLVEVVSSDVYDAGYRELSFQDETAQQVIGFRILVRDFTLGGGESKSLQLKSNSNSIVGLVFLVVTDPIANANVAELKSILEKQVSEDKIRLLELSPAEAKTIAKQINDVVNDASKTWQERKNELEGIAAAYGTEVSAYNASFVALASEIQPGALIQIPIVETGDLSEIVYKVEGDLSPYANIKLEKAENFILLKIFFDFRTGINSGTINVAGGNIGLDELTGELVVSFTQLHQEQRFPLKVLFDHVPANYFFIASPRNVFENNKLTIINNLPFTLNKINGCGLKDETLEAGGVLVIIPSQDEWLKCSLNQNGRTILPIGLSTEEDLFEREFTPSWLSCSEVKCDCEIFSDIIPLIEAQIFENTNYVSDPEAYEMLFGSDEYSFKLPIQTTATSWACDLPKEFESVKALAGNRIILKSSLSIKDSSPNFKVSSEKSR